MVKISKISDEKLEKIKGGTTISVWTGIAIAGIVIFLSGVIDGLINPKGCGE
ncbi:MAG: hypothetical protein IJG97_02490 [Bacilli bacterium]|nr:hypothetical protein [Bacilli bacterium]